MNKIVEEWLKISEYDLQTAEAMQNQDVTSMLSLCANNLLRKS